MTLNPVEPPWYVNRMPGGVGGAAPRGAPLSRSLAKNGRTEDATDSSAFGTKADSKRQLYDQQSRHNNARLSPKADISRDA